MATILLLMLGYDFTSQPHIGTEKEVMHILTEISANSFTEKSISPINPSTSNTGTGNSSNLIDVNLGNSTINNDFRPGH